MARIIEFSSRLVGDGRRLSIEMNRITQLAVANTLKEDDFAMLEAALGENENALYEIRGMRALARHEEYGHVLHGLSFLQSAVEGEHTLCPAHALGHYYVYKNVGEDEVAEETLEIVKAALHDWTELAEAYEKENPGSTRYAESKEAVVSHLADIENGDTTATEHEIEYLTNEGAVCFDEAGSVQEEHHDEMGHDGEMDKDHKGEMSEESHSEMAEEDSH